jgi:hypothetical protein
MRQTAQGFALVVPFFQSPQKLWPRLIVAEQQDSGVGTGPREVRLSKLLACGPRALACGLLAAFHQGRVGGEVLPPGKAADVMDGIEQHKAEDVAKAGHGVHQVEGLGVRWLGRGAAREFQVLEPCIVRGDEREGDRDGLLHGRLVKALGDTRTVGRVSDFFADLGQGRLAVGIVHMRQEVSALAQQGRAATSEVAGGTHLRRIDRRLGAPPPAQASGKLLGSKRVVGRRAAVASFHIARVSQDEGAALGSAEVGQPIPGEETFHGDHETLTRGRNRLAERFRRGCPGAVQQEFALGAHEADVHTPGLQVDTAVKGVLSGVESHGGLLLVREWLFPKASIPPGYAVGEASIIITGVQPTPSSVRCASASGSC